MSRLLLGLLLAVLLAGSAACATPPPPLAPLATTPPSPADGAQGTDAVAQQAAVVGPGESDAAPLPGLSVDVPSIEARSSLIPLDLNPDRTIQAPPVSTPEQAGLYRRGPVPGDVGPAVILGHISGGGQAGVFARLAAVREGDQVSVTREDGRVVDFTVYRTVEVDKADFPTSEVYSDTDAAEVRLISCGGALNPAARSYESNIIVFARET